MKRTFNIHCSGEYLVVNGNKQKISKEMAKAIKEYGKQKFAEGVRHQKVETFKVLGINDDPDSWI